MKICIIDADLIGRKKHRFPNLVCMKLSGYWKERGAQVDFQPTYDFNWLGYDHIFISCAFTDTLIPEDIMNVFRNCGGDNGWFHFGGTGFYYDKAPPLPYEIEHHMPDYTLYDDYISQVRTNRELTAISKGKEFNSDNFDRWCMYYTNYSIGYLTRGCFRKCNFCVNKKYNLVIRASPLEEFFDPSREKICLLDDNFFGYGGWKPLLQQLLDTHRVVRFHQGLDERLLTDEKCEMLFQLKYDQDLTFAFDKYSDYDIIHEKLELINKYKRPSQVIRFYVLCGNEGAGYVDLIHTFERIELLFTYNCYPYIMRYASETEKPTETSKYSAIYEALAVWTQSSSARAKYHSLQEVVNYMDGKRANKSMSIALDDFRKEHPQEAERFFNMKIGDTVLI